MCGSMEVLAGLSPSLSLSPSLRPFVAELISYDFREHAFGHVLITPIRLSLRRRVNLPERLATRFRVFRFSFLHLLDCVGSL